LRELEEELGVPAARVELLGPLTPLYLFVTNFHVLPWLAVARTRPPFRPSPAEVVEVIELPLALLQDPAGIVRDRRVERGIAFAAPHWACGPHRIWGATGMLLAELAALLADVRA
jgi:8-oxo-dGTP pyrophosphatase MutT (NUDIX family)